MGDKDFSRAWFRFLRRWADWGCASDWCGLRVFEPFQSGYLHCHCLVDYRFPIDAMRRMALMTGIGRMHVRRAWQGDGCYLGDYMQKTGFRLPGVKSWAKLGNWEHVRKNDLRLETEFTARLSYLQTVALRQVQPQRQRFVQALVVARRMEREDYLELGRRYCASL